MLRHQCLKFTCRRPGSHLLRNPKLPQLCAESSHFPYSRMVGWQEPLLEIKQMPRPAMVQRLHPPRLQVHLDPILQFRQRFIFEIVNTRVHQKHYGGRARNVTFPDALSLRKTKPLQSLGGSNNRNPRERPKAQQVLVPRDD